jgi:hypothetical protein
MWDLWLTKWHWGSCSLGTTVSPANLHSTNRYNRPVVAAVPSGLSPTSLRIKIRVERPKMRAVSPDLHPHSDHTILMNGSCLKSKCLEHSVSESESYVTTEGQSASLSWNKEPIWGLQPNFYYCELLMWGALSDERTSLSFTLAAGPRQRSHSRVRVPWNS